MPPGRRQRSALSKVLLRAERLDRHVGTAAGQLLHLGDDVDLGEVEHHIGAHALAISRRTGSLSTPMISEAPISFAPAVAHSPIGPWANTTTASPIRTPRIRRR